MGLAVTIANMLISTMKMFFLVGKNIFHYSIIIFLELNKKTQNPLLSAVITLAVASAVFIALSLIKKTITNIFTLILIVALIAILLIMVL